MHPQLEILLQLQDLKSQRRELAEGEAARSLQREAFNVDVERALEQLEMKIAEVEGQLSRAVRSRYDRLRTSKGRVVVPVIGGICYGCFIQIPTARPDEADWNVELRACENCGRFLYVLAA